LTPTRARRSIAHLQGRWNSRIIVDDAIVFRNDTGLTRRQGVRWKDVKGDRELEGPWREANDVAEEILTGWRAVNGVLAYDGTSRPRRLNRVVLQQHIATLRQGR
jgi:hypothetical protein